MKHSNAFFCQAPRCAAKVEGGRIFCQQHLLLVPPPLREQLRGIDPRGLLFLEFREDTLFEVEAIAAAIEAIKGVLSRAPNLYQLRAEQLRAVKAREEGQGTAGGVSGGWDGSNDLGRGGATPGADGGLKPGRLS